MNGPFLYLPLNRLELQTFQPGKLLNPTLGKVVSTKHWLMTRLGFGTECARDEDSRR
jgi:hypothetical protein